MACQDNPMVEFFFEPWWCHTESPWLDVGFAHTAVECVFDSPLCAPYCRAVCVLTVGANPLSNFSSFPVHVNCLSFHLKVDVLFLSVDGVRLDFNSAIAHNSVFPGRFHLASWATTVAALIMGVMLTLVPLCSRKGLTLAAIYADWLDRPGIPKVWGAPFALTQILSLLDIYSFRILKTFV